MKKSHDTIAKTSTTLLLICLISATHHSSCMDKQGNNSITVENKHNDPNGLLQIFYYQTEFCQYSKKTNSVGYNKHITTPEILKCLLQKNSKDRSSLYILDPRSEQEDGIKLKINNESRITINEKKNNLIIITDENKKKLGYLSYTK